MSRTTITFIIFLSTQLLLWLAAIGKNTMGFGEVLFLTMLLGVPLALFLWLFHWMRWVSGILFLLSILMVVSMAIEGFGVSFHAIGLLYAFIIYRMFSHRRQAREHVVDEAPDQHHEPITNGFYVNNTAYHYPRLVERYKSLLIDFVLMMTVMIVTMVILGDSDIRQNVMITLGVFLLFVYEPVLTAYKATLGPLGWLSFITITLNPKHRAIHDFASASVMIIKRKD